MSSSLIVFAVLLWTSTTFCDEQNDTTTDNEPSIDVVSMHTNAVVIAWNKTGDWADVNNYTVTIGDPLDCTKNVTCEEEDPCTFDSSENECAALDSCTTFNISVEGNGTISSLQNLTSAPPAVTNGTLDFKTGSVSCSWDLPDGRNCHDTTAITIKTLDKEYPIVYLNADNTTCTQNLTACDVGEVTCSIQALGGTKGVSDSESVSDTYSDEDAGSLIAELTLTPSNDSMELSWTLNLPEGDTCYRLSGYEISWEPGNPNDTYIDDNTTLTYTMKDLIPCTSYNVTLQPMSSKNSTLAKLIQESNDTSIVVLDPPSDVTVDEVTDTWMTVSWTQKEFGSLCHLESANVTWSLEDGTESQSSMISAENGTNYNISGLTPCSTYNIEVRSQNSEGYSLPSHPVNNNTLLVVLDPPSNVTVDEVGSTCMKVTWIPEEFGSLCSLESSTVTWSLENGTEPQSEKIPAKGGNIYNITDLIPCTTYKTEVISNNSQGDSQPSDPVQQNTTVAAPDAPTTVTLNSVESRYISVKWDAPPKTNCVKSYFVNYTGEVLWSGNVESDNRTTDSRSMDLDGLIPWTSYNICIAGVIEDGSLGSFNCCSTETKQASPSPPASFNVSKTTSKSVTLSWDEPEELNGILKGYLLSWGSENKTFSNETTEHTVDLRPKTDYNFTLQAMTEGGIGQGISVDVTTKANVLAIVLGVLGGLLVVVALAAVAFIYRKRIMNFKSKTARISSQPGSDKNSIELSPNGLSSASTSHPSASAPAPKPILKKDLRQYIADLEFDSQRGLEEEFASIKTMSSDHPKDASKETFNQHKNRFINILPYDHARVVLPKVQGIKGTDYINASYIKVIDNQIDFVASQGPKETTTNDFWRMIWELNSINLVMLTNLVEKGRDKCFKYWPDVAEGPIHLGNFVVHNHSEDRSKFHTIRYLEIQKGHQKRIIKQYHFTAWPDFGVPEHEEQLLDFITSIKSLMTKNDKPMVVHCSAGVGRTGTFIGLWKLMEYVNLDPSNPNINIKKAVLEMRDCRPSMVQAQDQYLYLCNCIAAYMEEPYRWNPQFSPPAAVEDHIYDNAASDDHIYGNAASDDHINDDAASDDHIYDNLGFEQDS